MSYKHIDILRSLSNTELKKLNKYIESPYFNESLLIREVHKYFTLLIKGNNDAGYSKEHLHRLLYPAEKFNEGRLRKMISLYTQQLENFLIYNEFNGETDTRNLMLMRSLRNRNLKKILGPLIKSTITVARKRKVRTYDDYIYLLKLQDEEYSFMSNSITGEGKKEWYKDQMKKFAEVTELSIVASTLATIQVVHYFNISAENVDQDIFLKDEILKRIESSSGLNYKDEYHYIYSKYLIVKIILDRTSKQNYKRALEYITANRDKFAEGFVYYAMISLYVLATDQVTYGFKDFSVILVDIYKAMDKANAFEAQSDLHYIFFMEVTNACIYCNEIPLAESMIKKYSGLIDPALRKASVNICRAQILFSKGFYSEALDYISKLDYTTFFLYMEAKILQSKIYYLLKDLEGLYAQIDTVSQYFRRNKDLPSREETDSYRSFFVNLKKMAGLVVKGKKDELAYYKREIEKQNFYNHDWISKEVENILVNNKKS